MPRLPSFGRRPRDDESRSMMPYEPDEAEDDPGQADSDYEEAIIEPFVPVPGSYDDDYAAVETDTKTVEPALEPRRRRRLSRPAVPRPRAPRLNVPLPSLETEIRPGVLLLALFLIAAGVFGTLLNQDRLQTGVREWWPVAILAVAAMWMLVALVRRQVASLLGGSAFGGVGLSLLMHYQDIAKVQETVLGVVLVTVGLGIVIRGFLLRQEVSPYARFASDSKD